MVWWQIQRQKMTASGLQLDTATGENCKGGGVGYDL